MRLPDGRAVVVTIVRVAGHQVRVGIDAPEDVRIVREELMCRDQSEDG